jgi:hypothetical protein
VEKSSKALEVAYNVIMAAEFALVCKDTKKAMLILGSGLQKLNSEHTAAVRAFIFKDLKERSRGKNKS